MAAGNLFITEYSDVYRMPDAVGIPANPHTLTQGLTTSSGAASAQSAAFQNNTRVVGISTDSGNAVNILFGTNPTATASSIHLPASCVPQYWSVPQGGAFKVAAIFSAT
jgi:hypothetical protein